MPGYIYRSINYIFNLCIFWAIHFPILICIYVYRYTHILPSRSQRDENLCTKCKGKGELKTRSPHAWMWSIVPEERTIPITHNILHTCSCPVTYSPDRYSSCLSNAWIQNPSCLAPQLLTIPIMQGMYLHWASPTAYLRYIYFFSQSLLISYIIHQ